MAAVAADAGVARGLVNHYFGTKRELYLDVVRAVMFVPEPDEVHLPTGTLRRRVEATVDWLMTVLAAHGRTWLAVGADGAGGDPEVRAILDEADHKAADNASSRLTAASVSSVGTSPAQAVRAYGGMVKAAVREWVDRGSLTQDQVRSLLCDALVVVLETAIGSR